MNPAPAVEVIDLFGNRVDSSAGVALAFVGSACGGGLQGGTANAVGGLATFAELTLDTPCEGVVLSAGAAGLIGTVSESFEMFAVEIVDPVGCGACGAGVQIAFAPLIGAGVIGRAIRARR